jgi:hypothetical protein
MPTREDTYYEIATKEVAANNLVPAVWGKAFSQAMGDNQVALALYIKLRVEQLERDYQEEQWKQAGTEIHKFLKALVWIVGTFVILTSVALIVIVLLK